MCHQGISVLPINPIVSDRPKVDVTSEVTAPSGQFVQRFSVTRQIIGDLIHIRSEYSAGDVSSHHMVKKATDAAIDWILQQHPELNCSSICGKRLLRSDSFHRNGLLSGGKLGSMDKFEALMRAHIKMEDNV